ncbi:alpha/beta hydrolase [Yanghanlia caeni]|uniref:Alpha/beta fold hydrolase n=1 Tax=Yanghanlia caeni TaxID=3064283 RepID=A0ABU1DA76_9BURK|nr:alpha/beta fold hydrolase [Alcaligenaceae bacterium LG-2]
MVFKRLLRHPRSLIAAGLLAAAGVTGYAQLDTWQRERIFSVEDTQRWWREAPEGTEIFDLELNNGHTVRAWYWQQPATDAPAVLYLHGSRWNLNGSVFRMQGWIDMGFSVLAIDYRGFGESTRLLPSERSVYEDAVAALHELARRQPDPARRFIFGHSLGGAIAIDLAARASDVAVAGIIVESSFTSIRGMLSTLEWGDFPGVGLFVTQSFASEHKLAAVTQPLLILHGTGDRVVPHTMSDQLYAAAVSVPPGMKRLVKIEGASHSGSVRRPEYEEAVRRFVERVRR